MKVEFFIPGAMSQATAPLIYALIDAARSYGDQVMVTKAYKGEADLLVVYGPGAPERALARVRHKASGKNAILWDLGYFGKGGNRNGWLRCSINHDHPQAFLDKTNPEPTRWASMGIPLREDYELGGHILLIGLGRKSRSYLGEPDWETNKYQEIIAKYPGQRVLYRPKPGHPAPPIENIEVNISSPIQTLLKGASLVVCRHSNVAVDAVIAGVPFDCEDGAAIWLKDKPYTRENRLDFLRRLAWWQWQPREVLTAWRFLREKLPTRPW
jgi:hypothetical protein